ncbi:MAG: hypothetical protein ACFFAN_06470 [Promethearchaeota archaeon]
MSIANGFVHLYYAIKLKKKFPKEHNIKNSVLIFILWIVAGLLYPFFYSTDNSNIKFFQILSTFFICIFTPFLIFLILFYQYRKIKKQPEVKKQKCFTNFFKEFKEKSGGITDIKTHSLKTDIHRKSFHTFPASLIIFLWLFAIYIWDGIWNSDKIWGISGQDFGVFLIITAGYSGILIFACLDYIRLSCIYEKGNIFWILPNNVLNLLAKAIKRKEFYDFIGPTVLILSFIPIFIFAHITFGIFAAAMLIATIGDGIASIFGMKFGKHNFPKDSPKTLEGYILGFIGSFGIAFFAIWVFESNITIFKLTIIALSGATMFLIIDISNLKVNDNILNPIICGYTMVLLFLLI